jgi:hypothetical protein
MNDYFQHLIDRNTSSTTVIRPRFSSVFEFPDVAAATVSNVSEVGVINRPAKKTERTPVIHPGLSPATEFPDAPDSTAVADFRSEIIHCSREKTGIDQEATAAAPYKVLPGQETSPEKLIRDKASEKHIIKDAKGATTTFSLYEDTVRIFPGETVDSVHQEAVINNVRPQAAPDLQLSAVGDDGANQKTDTLPSSRDEVERMAKRVSSQEAVTAASTLAPDSERVHDSRAGLKQQPGIRPLTTAEGGPQMSLNPPPREIRPEKTIKVTIGRIEVKAIMPQAPLSQPHAFPQEPQPKISLEDYLKKHRGGSR